ncbi:F0F1 ATP synthase subunit A [Actinoallomurus sp. NBC_01490]|jgi:F-type H+-transporting ATPase subunit a|uniref:F0F1 ATP synthase subunit A n=1 Tax=Actinoallomurus sp. NBC_01490 TaxID=2903557 RepID=UPI002E3197A5|nr:F0F1 ATP synthase subunit A [Actinoallomurus sp. NBC_01490]
MFEPPGLGLFEWKPLFRLGPVAVHKPIVLCLLVTAAVPAFFWAAFARPAIVPGRMQNLGELAYLFVRDQIARPMMGVRGDRWMGLLFSLFFFVWMANLMAVVPPAQFPVTGHIAFPAVLAGLVYVIMWVVGVRTHGLVGFIRHATCPPGLSRGETVLVAPLEFLSAFVLRPFTHAVRLFATMFAGHLLVALFATVGYHFLIQAPTPLGVPVGVVGVAFTVVVTALEVFVQAVQAYVFTLIAAYSIGDALGV